MSEPAEITLLTRAHCAYCDHAKRVLARLMAEFPLRVHEIDVTTDEGHRLASTANMPFAPGILLDGRPFAYGRLSERALHRALRQRTTDLPSGKDE